MPSSDSRSGTTKVPAEQEKNKPKPLSLKEREKEVKKRIATLKKEIHAVHQAQKKLAQQSEPKQTKRGLCGCGGESAKESEQNDGDDLEEAKRKAFRARHAKNIAKGKTSAAFGAAKVKW